MTKTNANEIELGRRYAPYLEAVDISCDDLAPMDIFLMSGSVENDALVVERVMKAAVAEHRGTIQAEDTFDVLNKLSKEEKTDLRERVLVKWRRKQ